jgi:hypothetical protein
MTKPPRSAAALAAVLLALPALAVAATEPPAGAAKPPPTGHHWAPEAQVLEPRAVEILKASSARLAGARTLSFTAVIADESPSRLGPPLLYASRSDVALARPDKLRVVTAGAGPRTELYVEGTKLSAFAPAEGLLAQAKVPPTIDGALEAAHRLAHVYYPFADLIVADPYGDLARDLRLAFYIGRSEAVGGTATDMVAYATDEVFVQAWIGVEDRLPRRFRAIYLMDGGNLRHEMDISDWKVDPKLPASTFALPAAAAKAKPIPFERPPARTPPPPASMTAPAAPAPAPAPASPK